MLTLDYFENAVQFKVGLFNKFVPLSQQGSCYATRNIIQTMFPTCPIPYIYIKEIKSKNVQIL